MSKFNCIKWPTVRQVKIDDPLFPRSNIKDLKPRRAMIRAMMEAKQSTTRQGSKDDSRFTWPTVQEIRSQINGGDFPVHSWPTLQEVRERGISTAQQLITDKMYKCPYCPKQYKHASSRSRHKLQCNNANQAKTTKIGPYGMQNSTKFQCSKCGVYFTRKNNRDQHSKRCCTHTHSIPPPIAPRKKRSGRGLQWSSKKHKESLNSSFVYRAIPSGLVQTDAMIRTGVDHYYDHLSAFIRKFDSLKVHYIMETIFLRQTDQTAVTAWISSGPAVTFLRSTNIEELNNSLYENILKNIDKFQKTGTGFTLHAVRHLDLHLYVYDPLRARGGHAECISANIRKRKALVDVDMGDETDACFKGAFLACVKNIKTDCNYSELRHFEEEFDFQDLNFPVSVYADAYTHNHTFNKFEIKNDASVNIYAVVDLSLQSDDEEQTIITDTSKKIHKMNDKKTKKKKTKKSTPCPYIDDQASYSSSSSSEYDSDEISDMEDFLDDSDAPEDSPSFYNRIDQLRRKEDQVQKQEELKFKEQNEDENLKQRKKDKKVLKIPDHIIPIRICAKERKHHANLLVVQSSRTNEAIEQANDETDTEQQHHFLAISSFSHLMSKQHSKHKCAKIWCYRCLQAFEGKEQERSKNEKLRRHKEFCDEQNLQRVSYPEKEEDKVMYFKDFRKMVKGYFVGYLDFEAFLVQSETMEEVDWRTGKLDSDITWPSCEEVINSESPTSFEIDESAPPTIEQIRGSIQGNDSDAYEQLLESADTWPSVEEIRKSCTEKNKEKRQHIFGKHVPASYALKIVSRDGNHDDPIQVYKGERPALHAINYALKRAAELKKIVTSNIPHGWTKKECEDYKDRHNYCHICDELIQDWEQKIIEHDHLTGKVSNDFSYCNRRIVPRVLHSLFFIFSCFGGGGKLRNFRQFPHKKLHNKLRIRKSS